MMIIMAILLTLAGFGAASDFVYTLRSPREYSSRAHHVLGLVLTGVSALACFGMITWAAFNGLTS